MAAVSYDSAECSMKYDKHCILMPVCDPPQWSGS